MKIISIKHMLAGIALLVAFSATASAQFACEPESSGCQRKVTVRVGNDDAFAHLSHLSGTYSAVPVIVEDNDIYMLDAPNDILSDIKLKSILTPEDYETFKKAHAASEVGYFLDKGTIVLVGGGMAVAYFHLNLALMDYDHNYSLPLLTGCAVSVGLGLLLQAASIPIKAVNNAKIRKIADKYNDSIRTDVTLALGATPNGIGLRMNF